MATELTDERETGQQRGQRRALVAGCDDAYHRPGCGGGAGRARLSRRSARRDAGDARRTSRTSRSVSRSARVWWRAPMRSARSRSPSAQMPSTCKVTVAWERFTELLHRRRNLTGRTGCGLCGAETAEDAIRELRQVVPGRRLTVRGSARGDRAARSAAADQRAHRQRPCGGLGDARKGHPVGARGRRPPQRARQGDRRAGARRRWTWRPATCWSRAARVTRWCRSAPRSGISFLAAFSAPTAFAVRLAQQSRADPRGVSRGATGTWSTPIPGD